MKIRFKRQLLACAVVLLILILTAVTVSMMRHNVTDIRQKEADNVLHYYSENILLRFRESLNEADTLAQTAQSMAGTGSAWFEDAAAPLLARDEVRYVCLFEGDTVTSALPKSSYGTHNGRDLKDFSYIYTMAKVVKELVVEGPVALEGAAGEQKVFLFLQPFMKNGAYMGEVVVALDSDYVLKQLGFDTMDEQGYDYELWRVEPQNGGKEVVAVSRQEVDFSHAVKTTFYLPTEWNLSIQPVSGWVSPSQNKGILLVCGLTALLLAAFACSVYLLVLRSHTLKRLSLTDSQTGLYNKAGFTAALNRWLLEKEGPVILFCFVIEGYHQISHLIDSEEKSVFLQSIQGSMKEFIESPFIAGRLDDDMFVLAVCEDMNENQKEYFAKEFSLELLLKTRLDSQKIFLTAQYYYACCQPGSAAEEELSSLIRVSYKKQTAETINPD